MGGQLRLACALSDSPPLNVYLLLFCYTFYCLVNKLSVFSRSQFSTLATYRLTFPGAHQFWSVALYSVPRPLTVMRTRYLVHRRRNRQTDRQTVSITYLNSSNSSNGENNLCSFLFVFQLPSAIRRRINIKVQVLLVRRERRRKRLLSAAAAASTDGKTD